MFTKEVKVENKTGIHARPASILVNVANKFDSEIKLISNNKEANLKSIISIMSLAIGAGETVKIQAEGADEQEAVEKIIKAIKEKLTF